jgi:hypothetical protein
MRAERSRGSRIRSPSWRNELIEKEIRKKARQCRAFVFVPVLHRGLRTRFLRIRIPSGPMPEGGLKEFTVAAMN